MYLSLGPAATRLFTLAVALFFAFFSSAESASAQNAYANRRAKVLMDAGQRHLDLGIWCRDRGLIPQATAEFLAAVEASDRKHPGANIVVSYMRSLDDGFWKKRRKTPSKGTILSFEKRAKKVALADQKDRLNLALLAWKSKMPVEAKRDYQAILRMRNAPLDFGAKGKLKIDGSSVPDSIATEFLAECISINDQLYLRDALLDLIPDVEAIQEVASPTLRVRGMLPVEQMENLHSLGEALFSQLQKDLHARPAHRQHLFIFSNRKSYDAYLDGINMSSFKLVSGLAQRKGNLAVVCAEGFPKKDIEGLVLHELTHLYSFAISRAVLPDWYSEGLAEQYGGGGTFEWDGENLVTGGRMAAFRLASLRQRDNRFSMAQMLGSSPIQLFAKDHDRALEFYAQCWALVHFLRLKADARTRKQFSKWEELCNGAALGAELGNFRASNTQPANALFKKSFGDELDSMEAAFHRWLDQVVPVSG